MGGFQEWVGKKRVVDNFELGLGKSIPENKNAGGGFDPTSKEQVKKFKKVDLITLPVEGTNCGNCMFMVPVDKAKGVGWCNHKDVLEFVTPKMCCAMWNHTDVKRQWETK
jgi:hypothetical protein